MCDSTNKITSFAGEYRFLSNFEPVTVEFERVTYPSVEHAYQAAKSENEQERQRIAALPSPGKAKRAGAKLVVRDGWADMKVSVMEGLLRQKFNQPELREKLLATG